MNKFSSFAAAFSLLAMVAVNSSADYLPYPNRGSENPCSYTFVAAHTGAIKAYFMGAHAKNDTEIGLRVNGADTGIYGLPNHDSNLGDELDFGVVQSGDVLTFVLLNHSLDEMKVYSDPSMNDAYDAPQAGANHVYSTAYDADPLLCPLIPSGTFVGFEDRRLMTTPDWDYNDEEFVFTNVAPDPGPVPSVPLPSAAWSAAALFPLIFARKRLAR